MIHRGNVIVGPASCWASQFTIGSSRRHRCFHNYVTWTQTGRPEIAEDERNIALYVFDEHTGDVVREIRRGPGWICIFRKGIRSWIKSFLEPFWTEFSMSRNYWRGALKNIVGFIPLGFCFYAYLATLLPLKRAALVTVALGTAVSFTIEILQAFLPTRDSGTTDLITNTLGTWVGVASYNLLAPFLARLSPWLPFHLDYAHDHPSERWPRSADAPRV